MLYSKSFYCFTALLCVVFPVSCLGFSPEQVERLEIGGAAFSGFTYSNLNAGDRAGFDIAANLDLSYRLSDTYTFFVQLQGGAGHGNLGFLGPEVVVTDLSLSYAKNQTDITLGSYDTPFGRATDRLTNNGDTSKHPLLANSLVYSAFAGPVGTLNTLGIKGTHHFSHFYITGSVSNGTGETAFSQNNAFEHVIQVGTETLIPNSETSFSYLKSEDQSDPTDSELTNSFATDLDGWIFDFSSALSSKIRGTFYVGELRYDDNNPATQDKVQFLTLETELHHQKWRGALRYSTWEPQDRSGDGQGISEDMPAPGLLGTLGSSALPDVSLQRIQMGLGYQLDEAVFLNAEVVRDTANHGESTEALYVYVNTTF